MFAHKANTRNATLFDVPLRPVRKKTDYTNTKYILLLSVVFNNLRAWFHDDDDDGVVSGDDGGGWWLERGVRRFSLFSNTFSRKFFNNRPIDFSLRVEAEAE